VAAKKVEPKPSAEGEELNPVLPGDEPEDALPWEEDFLAWNESERVDESTLTVTLYRLRPGKVKERVWRWNDEIPDEHEIGLQFGGGTYVIYATVSAPGGYRKVRHRRFVLAASYDAERMRAQKEQGRTPYPMADNPAMGFPVMPSVGPEFMMGMMERMMTAFMGAMAGRNASAAPSLGHWEQANEIVGRVVQSAAESQLKQSRDVTALIATYNQGTQMHEPEASEGDFKDYLKDMIREHGPTLLEAVGLKLKTAAGLVKRDEVFQSLAGDPALFGRILNLLAKDPEVDKTLAEKVLKRLQGIGVAVPLPPGFSFASRVNGQVQGQATG